MPPAVEVQNLKYYMARDFPGHPFLTFLGCGAEPGADQGSEPPLKSVPSAASRGPARDTQGNFIPLFGFVFLI